MMYGGKSINVQKSLPSNLSIERIKNDKKSNIEVEFINDSRREILLKLDYSDIILSKAIEILKKYPNHKGALLDIINYNNSFISNGRIINYCKKIALLNIESDRVTIILVEHYYKKKEWEEIIDLAGRVTKKSIIKNSISKKIITAFKKLKKSEGILEFTSNLGPYNKIDPNILKEMAKAYANLGRHFHSAKLWNKIDFKYLNKIDLLNSTRSNYNSKNYIKAISLCKLLEEEGGSFEIIFIRIRAEYMSQNWEECVETCDQALRKYKKNKIEIERYQSKSVLNLYKDIQKWYEVISIGE